MGQPGKTFRIAKLLPLLVFAQQALCGDRPAGKVVWWGHDFIIRTSYSELTNGVIESGNEVVTNAVSVAAGYDSALVLRSDGTVFACGRNHFGENEVPAGLSNVVSIAEEYGYCLAIKRDGSVALWGNDLQNTNFIGALSNVTSIASTGYRGHLALRNDGVVLGFDLEGNRLSECGGPEPCIRPAKVGGQLISNVVGLASMQFTPLVLKRDGTVWTLRYSSPDEPVPEPIVTKQDERSFTINLSAESRKMPYEFVWAEPVAVSGRILSNVVTISSGAIHALALKSDGTVTAWGDKNYAGLTVPAGLSNVIAITAGGPNLALRRDGTVVAWGDSYFGQTSVPAGLSNVVAIAAGENFGLALTTGNVPSSVFIQPHGRLEEMEREADLILKGRVISTLANTNTCFPEWGKPHATTLQVISLLKGSVQTKVVVFHHNTSGPNAWGGGTPPSWHQFETGHCYLVFTAKLDKPDYLYTPPADAINRPNEFRQLRNDGVTRVLDARPLGQIGIKDAHWFELNLLLHDTNPTNELYAVQQLDRMSLPCGESWGHSDDFKRATVLEALFPLITNANDAVAVAALGCFRSGSQCATQIAAYASSLVGVADSDVSVGRRVAALAAFSGTRFEVVSQALPRWLRDPAEAVREQAVLLLPDYPGDISEAALRERATDVSSRVRAAVAEAIGNGRIESLVPTLQALFLAPLGPTNPVPPLTLENLQEGGHLWGVRVGDVHTSAGESLLKFDTGQVGAFLKENLTDIGFRPSFLCKLAEKDAGPWLDDLVGVLEARRVRNAKKAEASGVEPRVYYYQALMALSGTYSRCCNIIYDHLKGLPYAAFAEGKLDHCLSELENAGNTGSREPLMLYELYRMKGLNKRAEKFRREIEQRFAAYGISQLFDKVDAQYPMNGAIPDQ